MKVVLVYDSKYGNTERIAQAIAKGLAEAGLTEVRVLWVAKACEDDFHDVDLWVIGSPTRWGGPTFKMRTLLSNAIKYEGKGRRAAVSTHGSTRSTLERPSVSKRCWRRAV